MKHEGFERLIREILPDMGYMYRPMNRRNIRRKVARRMEEKGIHEWDNYLDLLKKDRAERTAFEQILRVTITRFFRNAGMWEELGNLTARIWALQPVDRVISVWSAGCAGGEETYSLAMLFEQLTSDGKLSQDWEILGTDSDTNSLKRASQMIYRWGSVREIPGQLRKRWFAEKDDSWILDPSAGQNITFQQHDILNDPAPDSFNMILLRNNILTYNTEPVQRALLSGLQKCMEPKGLLFIGRKETVPEDTGFEMLSDSIYRKTED
ncbi:MAG: CheR family methyltransferase [bacterium]